MTYPTPPARPGAGPSAPDGAASGEQASIELAGTEQVFASRRERRAFEQAREQASALAGASPQGHVHEVPQRATVDVREADARLEDARRSPDAGIAHRVEPVAVSTHTGRVRLRPDDLARSTDSAPVPIALLGAQQAMQPDALRFGASAASVPVTRRSKRTASIGTAVSPARRVKAAPKKVIATYRRRSPIVRLLAKAGIMLAAVGLVATTAVPAYAQFDSPSWIDPTTGRTQTLAVGAVQAGAIDHDNYAAHTQSAALDSTLGSVVAPETQALAQQLMTAVTQGRLTGSTPDHIFEIRYLAAGEAVSGCGIDYRVLQTIAYALTKFNTVGISDINRHCTGQIEGAGTESAHYADGGGHAVDFFLLNGHALTGGDPDSIQLIDDLDAVVPSGANVGQENCRSGIALTHFKEIDDTCNHVHMDFLDAKGTTLLG